jgi:hypothetical protein
MYVSNESIFLEKMGGWVGGVGSCGELTRTTHSLEKEMNILGAWAKNMQWYGNKYRNEWWWMWRQVHAIACKFCEKPKYLRNATSQDEEASSQPPHAHPQAQAYTPQVRILLASNKGRGPKNKPNTSAAKKLQASSTLNQALGRCS